MDIERDYQSSEEAAAIPPVEVPLENLTPEILTAVIESFILREGTDYGVNEVALETKMNQIRKQLDKKQIRIVFDFASESVTLMSETDWKKFQK